MTAGTGAHRHRVAVLTTNPLSARRAGPAIRAWELAGALAAEHEVELATLAGCDVTDERFAVRAVDPAGLRRLMAGADVLVVQGSVLHEHPVLVRSAAAVVVDVYDPYHLEQLEQFRELSPAERSRAVRNATSVLNDSLLRADFLLCASERQRDFWLGQLAGLGRVNPRTYDADPTLRSLIDVVPFGVPDRPPVRTGSGARGVVPGIGADDALVLWGGGIYNWFDPLTLIRAVDAVRERRPDVRLLFLGLGHPDPRVPRMRMAGAAQELAQTLGLTGRHVFFRQGWVPYESRQDYLLEADVGVSTHLATVEASYAFRTRVLDYLWAGLPMVLTEGDALAELAAARGFGLTVPAGDVSAVADALLRLLDDAELRRSCRTAAAEAAGQLRWARVAEPLLRFCREPHRAPDLADPDTAASLRQPLEVTPPRWDLRTDVALLRRQLREGGPRLAARRAGGRLRRLVRYHRSG